MNRIKFRGSYEKSLAQFHKMLTEGKIPYVPNEMTEIFSYLFDQYPPDSYLHAYMDELFAVVASYIQKCPTQTIEKLKAYILEPHFSNSLAEFGKIQSSQTHYIGVVSQFDFQSQNPEDCDLSVSSQHMKIMSQVQTSSYLMSDADHQEIKKCLGLDDKGAFLDSKHKTKCVPDIICPNPHCRAVNCMNENLVQKRSNDEATAIDLYCSKCGLNESAFK